jgi:hypothetical protein
MSKRLRVISLISGAILISNLLQAQSDRFAYAMTDMENQNGNWVCLRIFNMDQGFSGSLINGVAEKQMAYDAVTKKPLTDLGPNKMGVNQQPAFNGGVAAIAYDSKHARIYYTPMFIDQLRYIDLKSMQVYYVTAPFTGKAMKSSDQGNIITRMVIAADGNGYAMTNDGTQLIRFTTGKKPEITDLGAVVDDPANNNISIRNSCSSYGGDMVADDEGNLYVFSARNHVFKLNIENKVATHLGVVSGLPEGFTINAAVVNENNQVIVGSAVGSSPLFVLDIKTWSATPLQLNSTVWHTSDLANGNLLSTNKPTVSAPELMSTNKAALGVNNIQVYPNPVTNNKFIMQFNRLREGNYTINITDVMGRQVLQQAVTISSNSQVQNINLNPSVGKGVYLVKVTDENSKNIFSSKLIVQ